MNSINFAPKNSQRQICYCYSKRELGQALSKVGLTPSPLPDGPFTVELSDGRTLTARYEVIGGAMDERGSKRAVLNIA